MELMSKKYYYKNYITDYLKPEILWHINQTQNEKSDFSLFQINSRK